MIKSHLSHLETLDVPLLRFRQTALCVSTFIHFAGSESNSLRHLAAVLRGQIVPTGDLTALDTNVVVMQILAAARESARTGRSVRLTKLEE